jgi:fatty-acyl-CoA synthase
LAVWLGLTRVGCVVALLNTSQTGSVLAHSLQIADVQAVVLTDDLASHLGDDERPRFALKDLVSGNDASDVPIDRVFPQPDDLALLIYTSGTTGLPKATQVTHRRIVEWSYWFAGMIDAKPDDRLYNCLPMYHSVGGIVAVGSMLVAGGSVVVRERFSASRFWEDVVQTECTIFQYIGELCRYLLQCPERAAERSHRLRLAVGNGLAGTIWPPFQARFNVPQILEFYAATEGGLSLYNVEGKPGSIGRVPPFLAGPRIVRCDTATGAIARGEDGYCIACGADEIGEAISPLSRERVFDGYTDRAASEKKLLRDVFVPGDVWYRTGDLMRRDKQGYFFFVDRLGDTFRWKGENVSTTEVEASLRQCTGIQDAVVYGVTVHGQEGRAGMAALIRSSDFQFDVFFQEIGEKLPEYARPMFVRLCDAFDITGTFKLNKVALQREGYTESSDPVWIYQRQSGYTLLSNAV